MKVLSRKLPGAYLKVKKDEIAWMGEYAGLRVPPSPQTWTFETVLKFKIEAREAIHRRQRGFLGESHIPEIPLPEIGGFRFNYDYQRVRFNVLNSNPGKILYPRFRIPGKHQRCYLVQSCQTALTQIFEALKRAYGPLPVWHPFSAYHETLRLFSSFGWQAQIERPKKSHLLLIDSSSLSTLNEALELNRFEKTKVVIFDTTCLERSDPLITSITSRIQQRGIPMVVIRSSLKLDSLGMEFGRFGHVLFLSDAANERFDAFKETYHELIPFYGNNCSSRQIYPFFTDPEFLRHSRNWVNRIIDSNRIFESAINGNDHAEVETFSHGLFSWLKFDQNFDESNHFIDSITQQLLFSGIPILATSSFPWDCIALTAFYNTPVAGLLRKRVLRISVGDYDPETASEYAGTISKIFKAAIRRAQSSSRRNHS